MQSILGVFFVLPLVVPSGSVVHFWQSFFGVNGFLNSLLSVGPVNWQHRYEDFTITDINAYVGSIAVRGSILQALGLPLFIFIIGRWLYKLFRLGESKKEFVVTGFFAIVAIAVIALFVVRLMSIDIWLPAFVGEGFSGYRQLLFNTGLLASEIYLPAGLVALSDLKVNVGKYVDLADKQDVVITKYGKPIAKIIRYDKDLWYNKKMPDRITSVEQLFGTLPSEIDLDDVKTGRLSE